MKPLKEEMHSSKKENLILKNILNFLKHVS
jgi:hypothetical protein